MCLLRLHFRLRHQGDDPGAVLELVAEVAVAVVAGVLHPHFPEDLEPAHAEAAEGGGVVHALVAFVLVVWLGPGRLEAAAVGPEVEGAAEEHVAGAADDHEAGAAGLFGDRSGGDITLERLVIFEDYA